MTVAAGVVHMTWDCGRPLGGGGGNGGRFSNRN